MSSRVIVVLGYSDGGGGELHPVCAARLERAAELSTDADVVVLSGWARVPGTHSEAELMRAAWRGAAREVVVDPDARTTAENMANALNDILRVGAREVVVVTSSWHAAAHEGGAPLALAAHRDQGAVGVAAGQLAPSGAAGADPLAAAAVSAVGGRTQGLEDRRRAALADLGVDPLLRLAQRAARAMGAHGEDLGEDRERRLLLRVRADVEPARADDPRKLLLGDARLEQPLAAALLVAARAERADVERLGLERRDQRGLVELVVVREDDDRRLVVGRDLGDRLLPATSAISRSADGIRSGVRNVARASATIAVQPSSFAPRQSASAVSTAP